MKTQSKKTFFIGPFPGPITGQTKITQVLFEELEKNYGCSLIKLDTVRAETKSGTLNTIVKIKKLFSNSLEIWTKRQQTGGTVYISLDANKGLYISLIYCLVAALARKKVVLHHHTYSHIAKKLLPMSLLHKLTKSKALHLCICSKMGEDLKNQYPGIEYITLNNAFSLTPIVHPKKSYVSDEITLGFLGRLTYEKGADLAIDTAIELSKNYSGKVKIILAGPAPNTKYIENLRIKYKKQNISVIETGMIHDNRIDEFYKSIDYFLFPTRYENETQGIVNIEALSYAVPSIAFGRCCIPTDVKAGGAVLDIHAHFPHCASKIISKYHSSEPSQTLIKKQAAEQFRKIHTDSMVELQRLASNLKLIS